MIIRSPKLQDNFYILNKSISEDESISWAARGLLIFLLGKPDNWQVSVPYLQDQTLKSEKPTKRDGIYAILNELINAGYVKRVDFKHNGKFSGCNYLVSEVKSDVTLTAKPDTVEPLTANTTLIRTDNKQELKEMSNDITVTPKKAQEWFNDFYAAYPKKVAKQDAIKAWGKIKPEQYKVIIADIFNRITKDAKWIDGYIPNPATYLNGKRWEDELSKPKNHIPTFKRPQRGEYNPTHSAMDNMQIIEGERLQ